MNAPRTHGLNPTNNTPKPAKRSSSVSNQQSLNHLLNFSLPPRVQHVQATPRRSKKAAHQIWNPERFINAQYRFVMRPTGDYTVHFADPDIYFQWQDILQVIIPHSGRDIPADVAQAATCPICLFPPTAPRMTKCGHVFCYPCILHYIETSTTPKWHRCPICFDSISAAQLKSVRWSDASSSLAPTTDKPIFMRLMQRPHITTLALPRSDTWQATSLPTSDLLQPHEAPFHFLPDVEQYARFMLASPEQLILDITGEIDALDAEERTLLGMGDELGTSFVIRAREKCLGMLIKAQEMENDASVRLKMEKNRSLLQEAMKQAKARKRREEASVLLAPTNSSSEDISLPSLSVPVVAPARAGRNKRALNPPPHSSSSYYYYQAASGANIFLHPLDIRILLAHFGSYSSFPNDIVPLVTSASESTVDDDLRRRCKYLGHLPEGADVVFVEADLEHIVGEESLKPFETLLRTRRARHKEKARKEERAKLRAEEKDRDSAFTAIASISPVRSQSSSLRGVTSPSPRFTPHVQRHEDLETDSMFVSPDEVALLGPEDLGSENEAVDVVTTSLNDSSQPFPNAPAPSVPVITAPAPVWGGAWGARSFASAAQSATASYGGSAATRRSAAQPSHLREDDEWEIDHAWHELEEAQLKAGGRAAGGNKRNRQKKLVLLGSGAGGRGR